MKSFQSIVRSQLSRYPLIQLEDLYKLTHQAAMGSEHAVKDIQSARDWLSHELEIMVNISTDPLFDEISADGQIMRINLKPYVERGGDPEILLQAFVSTANEYKGSLEKFKRHWMRIEQLAESGEINFQPDKLRKFNFKMDSLGFSAMHHSPQYEKAYNPHYRVVAREHVHQIIAELME